MNLMHSLITVIIALTSFVACASTNCPEAYENNVINYDRLNSCLEGEGVLLEVHGIVPVSSMFVVTYRNPKNFFQSVHLSLLGSSAETREMIKSLRRHDVVLVKGYINDEIPAPQRHLVSSSITLIERSPESTPSQEYDYEALPDVVLNMTELTGKVHAVYAEGQVLVIEYKDMVIPVFVKAPWIKQTKSLFRGDIVAIKYVVQRGPRRPVHLNLDPARSDSFRVLRSVVKGHGEPVKLSGKLLMFPKSPMVKFPVFAIDVDMGNGVLLPHTVLSFTDPELFKLARELFQAAWDKHPTTVRNYRNKFVNDAITVTVSGTYNMIDPGQANPQIVISSLSEIEIVDTK
jgi:hypothetical protein